MLLHLLSLGYATPVADTVAILIANETNHSAPRISAVRGATAPGVNGNNWPAKEIGAGACGDANGKPPTEYPRFVNTNLLDSMPLT